MFPVWLLTAAVASYGLATGFMINASPQACLALGFTSDQLGLTCGVNPLGYLAGCLLMGRLFHRGPGKRVLLGGALGSAAVIFLMARARTPGAGAAIQFAHGFTGGMFWPFASAWLMEFERPGLARRRLLRHYNLAWCSGIAAGLFASGRFCGAGWIGEAFGAGAACAALAFVIALLTPSAPPRTRESGAAPGEALPARVPLAAVAAAGIANFAALTSRSMVVTTYAELNQQLGFDAGRMGLITATGIAAQLVAFGASGVYEPWLGRRSLYVAMAAALTGALLAFATSSDLALILLAVTVQGVVMAVAFQTSIFAATGHFRTMRAGTSFHEAVVAVGASAPLAAGWLVQWRKAGGADPVSALRSPFYAGIALVIAALAVQVALGGRGKR